MTVMLGIAPCPTKFVQEEAKDERAALELTRVDTFPVYRVAMMKQKERQDDKISQFFGGGITTTS